LEKRKNNTTMAQRSFEEECSFIEKVDKVCYKIKQGFVPNMKVFH